MSELEPVTAEMDAPEVQGPTNSPSRTSSELHMMRIHAVGGDEVNFETWCCEVYIPTTEATVTHEATSLTRIRNTINVSPPIICFHLFNLKIGYFKYF